MQIAVDRIVSLFMYILYIVLKARCQHAHWGIHIFMCAFVCVKLVFDTFTFPQDVMKFSRTCSIA